LPYLDYPPEAVVTGVGMIAWPATPHVLDYLLAVFAGSFTAGKVAISML
jgi:hypothetical protein